MSELHPFPETISYFDHVGEEYSSRTYTLEYYKINPISPIVMAITGWVVYENKWFVQIATERSQVVPKSQADFGKFQYGNTMSIIKKCIIRREKLIVETKEN